jgi:phosphoribosylaminoimidazole-succinocarboxamide synthase
MRHMPKLLMTTALDLPNRRQGKVRDVYDCTTVDGEPAILLVATDRLSAFDVVMPNAPAGKGVVLTQMAAFWFALVQQHAAALSPERPVRTHLLGTDPAMVAGLSAAQREQLQGRVMVCRRTQVVPIECIARGYIVGSGWKEYQATGTVCGIPLPAGLQQAQRLPAPIFTPATKAEVGDHDENISFERACTLVGRATMERVRDLTLAIYELGAATAAKAGIILADTKFEFGVDADGQLILIDEILTPDSSRYWPADQFRVGISPPSYDKQFVRDWLEAEVSAGRWNKQSPGPVIPKDVLDRTMALYLTAYERLTGTRCPGL